MSIADISVRALKQVGRIADLQRPVFVLGIHRSRTTMVQRVINRHPRFRIWGEHAGFINKLAEAHTLTSIAGNTGPSRRKRASSSLSSHDFGVETTFDPWSNPFDARAFRRGMRRYISSTFSYGAKPWQRWGFKEIRYANPMTVAFLAEMFPKGQFVFVRRDLLDLCISNVFAPWSVRHLESLGHAPCLEESIRIVDDVCYSLVALDHLLVAASEVAHDQTLVIDDPKTGLDVDALFSFLKAPLTADTRVRAQEEASALAGASRPTQDLGALSLDMIVEHAPPMLDRAISSVRERGVDYARLRGLGELGRYSFLAGDHDFRLSHLSSLF